MPPLGSHIEPYLSPSQVAPHVGYKRLPVVRSNDKPRGIEYWCERGVTMHENSDRICPSLRGGAEMTSSRGVSCYYNRSRWLPTARRSSAPCSHSIGLGASDRNEQHHDRGQSRARTRARGD
eukprot:scaffold202423_cov30-Tisochrysis_lutea.AAC.2